MLNETYGSLNLLLVAMQKHAGPEGYAVCQLRIKKCATTGLIDTCYICCDRGRKDRQPRGQKRLHGTSRTIDCPFSVVVKSKDDEWIVRDIRNPGHNHSATVEGSHPSLRKLAITPAIADEIVRATKVQMKPSQILSSLRLGQTDDINDNNPLFKRQDIYNAKAEIRRKALGRLTPIQALMQELNRPHWYVRRRCNVLHTKSQ